jgi:hypothetical protein
MLTLHYIVIIVVVFSKLVSVLYYAVCRYASVHFVSEQGIKINIFKLPSNKRICSSCIPLHDTGVICTDSTLLCVAFSDPGIRYRNLNLTYKDSLVIGRERRIRPLVWTQSLRLSRSWAGYSPPLVWTQSLRLLRSWTGYSPRCGPVFDKLRLRIPIGIFRM